MRKKIMQCQLGQALVEFTLVLTIFLVMLGALIDFSILIYHKHCVDRAAHEAARTAARGFNLTRITDAEAAAEAIFDLYRIDENRATITVQDVSLSVPSVQADVSYPYDFFIIPLPLPTVNVRTVATMRREG